MDLRYAAGVFGDFRGWVQRNQKEELKTDFKPDLENMPAMDLANFDPDKYLDELIEANPAQFEALLRPGGFEKMVEDARSQLAEDAGEFEIPRRLFRRVDLPIEIDLEVSTPDEISDALKPYLRGDELVDSKWGIGRAIRRIDHS